MKLCFPAGKDVASECVCDVDEGVCVGWQEVSAEATVVFHAEGSQSSMESHSVNGGIVVSNSFPPLIYT